MAQIGAQADRKRCSHCRLEKPSAEFSSNRRGPDQLDATCRICNAERTRRKKWRYVAAGSCADCGSARETQNRYCDRCAREYAVRNRQRARSVRLAVLQNYSGGAIQCACCGECQLEFLTVDHINNDGKAHRRRSKTAHGIYRDLLKHGCPPVIEILCFNCNMARASAGVCPHRGEVNAPLVIPLRVVSDVADPDVVRRCTCCNRLVPRAAFYRDSGTRSGLQSRSGGCTREAARARLHRIRDEVFAHYGGADVRCVCCGEATRAFLALDHVEGGGTKAIKAPGPGGNNHYVRVKTNGFPPGLQILCHNCNCAKGHHGACPHVSDRAAATRP
jgi:hypothetical protein